MNEVNDAFNDFLAENALGNLPVETQLRLAFGAGVIFGSKKIVAALETKVALDRVEK